MPLSRKQFRAIGTKRLHADEHLALSRRRDRAALDSKTSGPPASYITAVFVIFTTLISSLLRMHSCQ